MKIDRLIILSVLALLSVSCNGSGEGGQQQSLEDISKQELAMALEERDQLLALVKEISIGMVQIKNLENIMTIAAARPNENTIQKSQILADIANLKEKIRQRKDQLKKLEEELQNSTINSKELNETVEALRIQIDSQLDEIDMLKKQLTTANEQIGRLNNAVDSLNTTVSEVRDERDAAHETSVRLENELNICFYVIATKSELKSHHIIESGFLRRTRLLEGDFDKGFFVSGDKRMLDSLPLNTKKAKILTNHPATSYEIIEEDGQKIIKISNSDEFWSLTDYLVVQKD